MDLPFEQPQTPDKRLPLAERMRPKKLDDFVGQEEIVGANTLLRRAIAGGEINQSMILWGPPGCGKTTLARLIAAHVSNRFVPFSAVTSGIAEVKRVITDAKKLRSIDNRPLLLFVDEIHRFNKAQQDAFLPHIEDGTIVFIGATTENPSFEVIGPLLSRSRVFVFSALTAAHVEELLRRAVADEQNGLGARGLTVDADALALAAEAAHGDARVALNALDYAASVVSKAGEKVVTRDVMKDALQKPMAVSDKAGEAHYNLISALHKSIRGGDPDASLYWLARMMEAGEDPMYIARRLVRAASEDIGNADPQALVVAVAAKESAALIGYPECKLALAQCAVYLALAPKSNAVYTAYSSAADAARNAPPYPVPLAIRNAPTRLMKELGYGKDYKYDHDYAGNVSGQAFLPEELVDARFYRPKAYGFEKELAARLQAYRRRKKNQRSDTE